MPMLNGKKYSYDAKGRAAHAKAKKKKMMDKKGVMPTPNRMKAKPKMKKGY